MKYRDKLDMIEQKYKDLYKDSTFKAGLLSKAKKQEDMLKVSIALKKLLLKRHVSDTENPKKGWVMELWEKDLEKGWKCFTVPDEPEKKPEPSPKVILEKENQDEEEDSDIDREIAIMMKNSSRSRRINKNLNYF